jgi:hypothetical protein
MAARQQWHDGGNVQQRFLCFRTQQAKPKHSDTSLLSEAQLTSTRLHSECVTSPVTPSDRDASERLALPVALMLCVCLFCHVAGNAGLAAAVAAFYQAKQFANSPAVGLWDASFADITALGSLLAMARCDGPHVRVQLPCNS